MTKVFVSVGMSLDGFVAGPNRGPSNPLGDRGPTLHQWMFHQRAFRQRLGIADDGETGEDNAHVERTFARTGANVMGRRMFDEGEANWPETAPFRTPVFVVTHAPRPSWVRPGGTTFHFVRDFRTALANAREAAGGKDVCISGGAQVIREALHAGVVDELTISLAPIMLGDGLRLLDGIDRAKVQITIDRVIASPQVTHLTYAVRGARRT